MSKQKILYIAQVLTQFQDMGATEADLESEKEKMFHDDSHLIHNLIVIGQFDAANL